MFSVKQLNLLKTLLDYRKHSILHLYSTGTVSATLPKECGEKQQFYYALVVRPVGGEESPVVPVLEFISNNQSVITISTILHHFFNTLVVLFITSII